MYNAICFSIRVTRTAGVIDEMINRTLPDLVKQGWCVSVEKIKLHSVDVTFEDRSVLLPPSARLLQI